MLLKHIKAECMDVSCRLQELSVFRSDESQHLVKKKAMMFMEGVKTRRMIKIWGTAGKEGRMRMRLRQKTSWV
jgi:hypothetical protein